MKGSVICAVCIVLLAACCGPTVAVGSRDPASGGFYGAVASAGSVGCPALPSTFNKTDLIGTWTGDPGCSKDTTITLRADHTYLDVYRQEQGPDRWQGTGNERWWVEQRQDLPPLLHLTGMRFCHEDRDKPCASKTPDEGIWYDFCAGGMIRFHGEVIMLIVPAPADIKAPRGILLEYLVVEPDSITTAFRVAE